MLAGGPGTGKTTTVARLLPCCAEQASRDGCGSRIALAAPTGKAAARLQEAVQDEAGARSATGGPARLGGLQASTLHRLLGCRPETAAASATTAATGCRTTWSSSTRPRWCR